MYRESCMNHSIYPVYHPPKCSYSTPLYLMLNAPVYLNLHVLFDSFHARHLRPPLGASSFSRIIISLTFHLLASSGKNHTWPNQSSQVSQILSSIHVTPTFFHIYLLIYLFPYININIRISANPIIFI